MHSTIAYHTFAGPGLWETQLRANRNAAGRTNMQRVEPKCSGPTKGLIGRPTKGLIGRPTKGLIGDPTKGLLGKPMNLFI